MTRKLEPIHPGEVLLEEFLTPLGITPYRLAKSVGISGPRAYDLARGERNITADTALRLSAFFGTTPEFWMNLQSHYDLERARDAMDRSTLAKIKPFEPVP